MGKCWKGLTVDLAGSEAGVNLYTLENLGRPQQHQGMPVLPVENGLEVAGPLCMQCRQVQGLRPNPMDRACHFIRIMCALHHRRPAT